MKDALKAIRVISSHESTVAEFKLKHDQLVEEADEAVFWMEVLIEADIVSQEKISTTLNEAKEILAVVSKARKSASTTK